jgi:hypothetical protein
MYSACPVESGKDRLVRGGLKQNSLRHMIINIYNKIRNAFLLHLFIVILLGVLSLSKAVSAQDANYWTFQYGSRSTLLGGAVIGSVLDLSGTYYNPGAVSLIENPETILAAKVFEYPRYKLEGTLLNKIEMTSSTLGPAPSLVATNLKFDWLGDNNLVLSLLTRFDLRYNLNHSNNFTAETGDVRDLIVNARTQEEMGETWFGITWSQNYGHKMGIGFTPYVVFRSHNLYSASNFQTVSFQDEHFLAVNSREYEYDHYSLLLKTGITFDFIGQTIGLTVTTPRLGFYNNGSSGLNQTIDGVNPRGGENEISYVAANYQNDVNATFKSPWSTAIGTTFKIDRTNIYISAEWFSPISRYEVIPSQIFTSQIGSDTLSNEVTSEAQSVINFGIGIQHTFNNSYTINASFTSDFSASIRDSDTNLSIASWNIYHLMIGGSFNILEVEFTIGVGYAFGSDQVRPKSDAPSLVPEYSLAEIFNGTNFSYQSYKAVFGFAF